MLDFSAVDHKISDDDRNAVEEAVRLKEALGEEGLPGNQRGESGRGWQRRKT